MTCNVLTLFPSAVDGGTEQLVLDQMKLYDRSSYNYFVVALRRGHLDDRFRAFPNYECMGAGLKLNPMTLWRLHRLVKLRRVDVLHTHLQEADFYGYVLKRMNHGLVWISTRHNTDTFRKKLFWRRLNGATSRFTTHIVAVSNAVKDFVVEYESVSPDRISVIYNGADTTRFGGAHDVNIRKSFRRSLRIRDNSFVVGIVGRLTEQKGHRCLFEALARIQREAPDVQVVVLGKGALEGQLRRLAKRLGIADRVSFAGYRTDIAGLYSAMDVFCLPSLFEGFGLAFVEAMLCGTPVIGTRVDGIREIIQDGVNGFLVDPADAEALSRVLLRVYRREFDRTIIEQARRRATLDFDFEKNLRRLEALYLRATATAHPALAVPADPARAASLDTHQQSASDLRARGGS